MFNPEINKDRRSFYIYRKYDSKEYEVSGSDSFGSKSI